MPQSEIAITQSSSTHSRLQQQLKMPLPHPMGHYKTSLGRKVKDKHEPVTRPQHGKSSFIPKSPPLHLPEHHSVLVTRYIFASLSFFWCHLTKLFVLVQQPTGFYSIWQKHCMILLIMLDMYFLQQHWFSSHEVPFKISIVKKKCRLLLMFIHILLTDCTMQFHLHPYASMLQSSIPTIKLKASAFQLPV